MIIMTERIPTRSHGKVTMPRPCLRAGNHVGFEALPVSAFSWGEGKGASGRRRRRGVCDDCLAREAAEKAQRHAEWQSTFVDPVTGQTMRRCSSCRVTKEVEEHFYVERRHPDGSVKGYAYVCKPCTVERIRALRDERLSDPVTAAEYRAARKAHTRKWRERNPEAYHRMQRNYRARVKADPERYARRLESERIAYHLRMERQGRVAGIVPGAVKTKPRLVQFPRLPAAPLLRELEDYCKRNEVEECNVDLGVDDRSLRRWREQLARQPLHSFEGAKAWRPPTTTFDSAERALIVLNKNLWDVWPEGDHPQVWKRLTPILEAA